MMNEFTFHIGKQSYLIKIKKRKRLISAYVLINNEKHEIGEIDLPKIIINKDKSISDDEIFFQY